jgi:hypothetical protein
MGVRWLLEFSQYCTLICAPYLKEVQPQFLVTNFYGQFHLQVEQHFDHGQIWLLLAEFTTKDCHQTEIKFPHVGHEGYRHRNVTSVPILNLLPYIEDDSRNLPLSFNTLDWSVFLTLAAHPYLGQLHKHLVLGISFSNLQCFEEAITTSLSVIWKL